MSRVQRPKSAWHRRVVGSCVGWYEVVKVRWAFRRIEEEAIWNFEILEFGFEIRNPQSEIANLFPHR